MREALELETENHKKLLIDAVFLCKPLCTSTKIGTKVDAKREIFESFEVQKCSECYRIHIVMYVYIILEGNEK